MLMQELTRVKAPPPLPNPHWLRWEHPDAGVWPAVEFLDRRDQTLIPEFVTRTAHRAAQRLRRSDLPNVLGHGDFEAQNIRWQGAAPVVVHDWDSLCWLPEAALTGAAAGAFASTEVPTLTPIQSSAAFLEEYQITRRRTFTAEEIEVAWVAILWPAAHNARAQALHGHQPIAGEALRTQPRYGLPWPAPEFAVGRGGSSAGSSFGSLHQDPLGQDVDLAPRCPTYPASAVLSHHDWWEDSDKESANGHS